jgi:UDP:flavonoid glycosyltransferase YjiC (YdhE family)
VLNALEWRSSVRVLFTTSPGIGHVFPTIPIAHALRAAGHEVLYALGGNVAMAAGAGMPVADTAPDVDFVPIFREFGSIQQQSRNQQQIGIQDDDNARLQRVARLFARVSEVTVDATVEVAGAWQPDLVVYSPLQGAGPLVAAKLGVPAVAHGLGFASVTALGDTLRDELSDSYDKHGVRELPTTAALSVAPPSMLGSGGENDAWPMRYVPYNGGGVLPDWVLSQPDRPRIAVTLGTAVPHMSGVNGLAPLLAAAGAADVEVVLALGEVDAAGLSDIPDNVRLCQEWIPLGALLRTCVGAIHHGGAGTTLTTLDAGIPQLVVPHGADQHINAGAVRARGAGDTAELPTMTPKDFDRLLTDEAMRTAATEVRAEMTTMPAPSELVPRLVALAASGL